MTRGAPTAAAMNMETRGSDAEVTGATRLTVLQTEMQTEIPGGLPGTTLPVALETALPDLLKTAEIDLESSFPDFPDSTDAITPGFVETNVANMDFTLAETEAPEIDDTVYTTAVAVFEETTDSENFETNVAGETDLGETILPIEMNEEDSQVVRSKRLVEEQNCQKYSLY